MSRRAEYHLTARFVVSAETVEAVRAACTPTAKHVWIGTAARGCSLLLHTFRGVPGKDVDVLLPRAAEMAERLHEDAPADLVCEIGLKVGCFDGAKRWRLTFRTDYTLRSAEGREPTIGHPSPKPGRIVLKEEEDALTVICLWTGPEGMWAQKFHRLRYTVADGDRRCILLWQWQHYYRFLPEDDVRALAEYWSVLPVVVACEDIAALNRLASAALYDLARQLGWRKLTLREKRKLHIDEDSPQWQRTDKIERRLVDMGYRTGCGQYTTEAAQGREPMRASPVNGYVQTSHGAVEVE